MLSLKPNMKAIDQKLTELEPVKVSPKIQNFAQISLGGEKYWKISEFGLKCIKKTVSLNLDTVRAGPTGSILALFSGL